MLPIVVASALLAPIRITGSVDDVDLETARAGVTARLGEVSEDWTVEVRAVDAEHVYVDLGAPDGSREARQVALEEGTPEARGRSLASALAIVIETHRPLATPEPEPEPAPEPAPEPEPVRGWLAVGGHLHHGALPRPALAGGVSLAAGAWLVRDHIQPRVTAGWSRARSGGLVVDAGHFTGGAAFGAAVLRETLWLGAGVEAGATAAFARAEARASGWSAQLDAPLLAQVRWSWLMVELHAGPRLTLPPLRFVGADTSLRWGALRFAAGLRVGIIFGRSQPR